jgi:hypothetical protein
MVMTYFECSVAENGAKIYRIVEKLSTVFMAPVGPA